MTAVPYIAHALFAQGSNMNTPPNPPSPADEDTRRRIAGRLQRRLVQRLKKTFPGLPF